MTNDKVSLPLLQALQNGSESPQLLCNSYNFFSSASHLHRFFPTLSKPVALRTASLPLVDRRIIILLPFDVFNISLGQVSYLDYPTDFLRLIRESGSVSTREMPDSATISIISTPDKISLLPPECLLGPFFLQMM